VRQYPEGADFPGFCSPRPNRPLVGVAAKSPQRSALLKMILRLSRKLPITDSVLKGAADENPKAGAGGVKANPKMAAGDGVSVPRIDASTLLASGKEVILVHKDTQYRLRLTSNDKLILTK